jgi:hypothetical protein
LRDLNIDRRIILKRILKRIWKYELILLKEDRDKGGVVNAVIMGPSTGRREVGK